MTTQTDLCTHPLPNKCEHRGSNAMCSCSCHNIVKILTECGEPVWKNPMPKGTEDKVLLMIARSQIIEIARFTAKNPEYRSQVFGLLLQSPYKEPAIKAMFADLDKANTGVDYNEIMLLLEQREKLRSVRNSTTYRQPSIADLFSF